MSFFGEWLGGLNKQSEAKDDMYNQLVGKTRETRDNIMLDRTGDILSQYKVNMNDAMKDKIQKGYANNYWQNKMDINSKMQDDGGMLGATTGAVKNIVGGIFGFNPDDISTYKNAGASFRDNNKNRGAGLGGIRTGQPTGQ